jgi:hypothetical protein
MEVKAGVGSSRVRRAIVLIPFALVVTTGCGGDEPSETITAGSTAGADAREYIGRADLICQRATDKARGLHSEYDALQGQGITADNAGQTADLLRKIADATALEIRQLRRLPPPSGDADVIDDYLSAGEISVALQRNLADAYESRDARRIRTLTRELRSNGAKTEAIGGGYGFGVCPDGV